MIRFLEAGSKVKVTIMFRGREQSRRNSDTDSCSGWAPTPADYGFVETSAKQDGRNMTMVLAPHQGAKTRAKAAQQAGGSPVETPQDSDVTQPENKQPKN